MKKLLLLCLLTTLPLAASKTPAQLLTEYNSSGLPGKTRALQNIFALDPARVPDDEFNEIVTIVTQLQKEGSGIIRGISLSAEWDRLIKKAQSAHSKEQTAIARALADRTARLGKERDEKAGPQRLSKDVLKMLNTASESRTEKEFLGYLKSHPEVVYAVDKDGNTLLMLALMEKRPHMGIIQELIKLTKYKDIDQRDGHGETALMVAAREGNADAVKTLLGRGAKVNAHNDEFSTPLLEAVAGAQDMATLQLLVQAGADVRATDTFRKTAVHLAIGYEYKQPPCECPESECDEKECSESDEEEECDCDKWNIPTAQQVKTITFLRSRGAPLEAQDYQGHTPFMCATHNGNVPVMEYLIGQKINIDTPDIAGITPLVSAIDARGFWLNDTQSSLQDRTENINKSLRVIKILLNAKAKVNPRGDNHPLANAIWHCDVATVQLLLMYGADPNAHTMAYDNALGYAQAMQKYQWRPEATPAQNRALDEIIKLLQNPKGYVAGQRALQREQKDIAQSLGERRHLPAELESQILEFVGGPEGTAKMSREQAVIVNKIKQAMSSNDTKALLQIFKDPATLEIVDEDGNTPLLLALHYQEKSPYSRGNTSALNAVVASLHNADRLEGKKHNRVASAFEHRNRQGFNALELARALGLNKEVIEYLEQQVKPGGR